MSTSEQTSVLSFETLRKANGTRLPLFKNGLGEPAHSQPDGSDWTPAQWLQALLGELGEFARIRLEFEAGRLPVEDYTREAHKELADVQCYLDILARRALDIIEPFGTQQDQAGTLMELVADLGEYANCRKKFERGDVPRDVFEPQALTHLGNALDRIPTLLKEAPIKHRVSYAHNTGVDLGLATALKFNEVSRRISVPVYILDNRVTFKPLEP